MGVSIRTLSGREIALPDDAIDGLRGSLHGRLLTSDSTGYDEARTIWNAMVERRPALIARCIDAQDVATAVRFARENSLLTSVRGGGHNIAGNAVSDDGFMMIAPRKNTGWRRPSASIRQPASPASRSAVASDG